MRAVVWVWLAGLAALGAVDAEEAARAPDRHVFDAAGVLESGFERALVRELEDFERTTSVQIVVAVMPSLPPDVVLESYTHRLAESWGVGQERTDNGAVLFVFVRDRKMRIEVGYGLEGAIPDALAKQIIDHVIAPHFRAGAWDEGVREGARALMRAAQGEYRGSGRLVAETRQDVRSGVAFLVALAIIVLFVALARSQQRGGGYLYTPTGRRRIGGFGGPIGGGGWGGFSGGGGGFSGGGGSFGGGGASGSW